MKQADFANAIGQVHRHIEQLRVRAEAGGDSAEAMLNEAIAELETSLEELNVAEQELSRQSEQIAQWTLLAQQARNQYQELFDFAPDPYLVTSLDGVIRDANLAAAELLGADRRSLIGTPIVAFLDLEHRPDFRTRLRQMVEKQTPSDRWMFDLVNRKGEIIPVDATVATSAAVQNRIDNLRWLLRDVSERRSAERQLQASERRYRTLIETAPVVIVGLSSDFSIIQWNDEANRIFGIASANALNRNFLELCIPAEMRGVVKNQIEVVMGGASMRQFETHIRGESDEHRILFCCCALMPAKDDHGPEVTLCCQDITDRQQAAHQRLLVQEIEHRVKNNLATVLAISDQTLATATSLGDFKQAFTGRIAALSQMHMLLTQNKSHGLSLKRLVEQAVLPYLTDQGPRTIIEGPAIVVGSKTAQCFCIALHELATNAAKYGALSVLAGQVSVRWQIIQSSSDGSAKMLHVAWVESGGPVVQPPSKLGLGTQLTQQCIEYEMQGKVNITYAASGLKCNIQMPWNDDVGLVVEVAEEKSSTNAPNVPHHQALKGKRILLVEDNHLVAVEVARMLRALGCEVVGPVATVHETMQFIKNEAADCVLLDVNLNGVSTWTVADELLFRDAPFVFITGYSCPGSLPPEFRHCHWLEKPFDQSALENKLGEALTKPN